MEEIKTQKTDLDISEDHIFNIYHKYRASSYNKTISYNDQIFKFKEKISNYEKIFRDIQKHKYKQNNPNEILIFVKEDNKMKTYSCEQAKSIGDDDDETAENKKDSESEKKNKKVNSEPDIDPVEDKENMKINKDKDKEKEAIKGENKNTPSESKDTLPSDKPKSRTFIVKGGYADIAKALLNRGWTQIKDVEDQTFDYFYPLKSADIHYTTLLSNQMVGHYWKANEITRKSGLIKNLRNLYFKGVNVDNWFPRAYELSEKNDLEDFIEDFKNTKAVSILKECLIKKGKNINKEIVETAVNICKRKIKFVCEEFGLKSIFDNVVKKTYKGLAENKEYLIDLINEKEWEIISNEDMEFYNAYVEKLQRIKFIATPEGKNVWKNKKMTDQILKKRKIVVKNTKNPNLRKDIQDKPKDQPNEQQNEEKGKEKEEAKKEEIKEEKKEQPPEKVDEDDEEEGNERIQSITDNNAEIIEHPRPKQKPTNDFLNDIEFQEIKDILKKLSTYYPQYVMDGTNNIWIAKPGGLSRGRGIHCVDQLNDILSNIKICGQTIIQKYIENPLIIHGRKFDMRQWVLVTDFSPLTIWLFDTPYLRFGAEDYNINNFKNIYSHLTNNSIAKHSENFKNTDIEGDMWEIEQFQEYLIANYGKNYWPEIQEKIKKMVIYSLQSAKHKIMHRKNSHEVFGYDFMIDDKLNAYLIEINASPDWTYSTKVTEKLVKICSDDIIKVVVDYADNMKLSEGERKKDIDTGRLKLIFNGNDFPKFTSVNGIQHEHI